jgi:hypothetical protein
MLTDEQRTTLHQIHIDSAEELLGLVKSDPEKAQSFLKLGKTDLARLTLELTNTLDPSRRKAFEENSGQQVAYGAWIPSDDEQPD